MKAEEILGLHCRCLTSLVLWIGRPDVHFPDQGAIRELRGEEDRLGHVLGLQNRIASRRRHPGLVEEVCVDGARAEHDDAYVVAAGLVEDRFHHPHHAELARAVGASSGEAVLSGK